jgi:hypothetical protein
VNGKVERFNRTLLEEWTYVRPYTSNGTRPLLLYAWLHRYNYHPAHTNFGVLGPVTRGNNLRGAYTQVPGRSAKRCPAVPNSPARRV